MLGYADALEQNGDTDRAGACASPAPAGRRERRPTPTTAGSSTRPAAQPACASPAARTRATRPTPCCARSSASTAGRRPFSPAARELVLAWFIDQGQIEGVRGFLWHQYGKSLARPVGRNHRRPRQRRPREGRPPARTMGRAPAPLRPGQPGPPRRHPAIAATAAFEAMDLQRDDETSHLQLTEIMLEQADRADLDLAMRQLGSIDETFTGARLTSASPPAAPLAVELGRVSRQIIDRNFASAPCPASRPSPSPASTGFTTTAPPASPSAGATATPATRPSSSSANSASTASSASPPPSAATSPPPRTPPCASPACASKRPRPPLRLCATSSTCLRRLPLQRPERPAVGRARQTQLGIRPRLPQRAVRPHRQRFASNYAFEGGVDTTGDARAIEIKQRLFATTPVDAAALAPSSFNLYGLRLSTNTRHITDYTRALRPFGSVGLLHNSVVGAGYDYSLGLAGSVLGNDHFRPAARGQGRHRHPMPRPASSRCITATF